MRPICVTISVCSSSFQSTHSLRSATEKSGNHDIDYGVSIHALLTECDLNLTETRQKAAFQSTHSLRSATAVSTYENALDEVSIHALLTECDLPGRKKKTTTKSFNPRTPYGVRLTNRVYSLTKLTFQSTHSLRSATAFQSVATQVEGVSIHALLTECDELADVLSGDFPVSIHALLTECDTPIS